MSSISLHNIEIHLKDTSEEYHKAFTKIERIY